MTPTQTLIDVAQRLADLNTWDTGSAYVRAAFVTENRALKAELRAAIAACQAEVQA